MGKVANVIGASGLVGQQLVAQLLGFRKCIIVRPSILDGDRKEKRTGEKIGLVASRFLTRYIFKKYRPTPVDVLVSKMISLSIDQKMGFMLVEGLEIFK